MNYGTSYSHRKQHFLSQNLFTPPEVINNFQFANKYQLSPLCKKLILIFQKICRNQSAANHSHAQLAQATKSTVRKVIYALNTLKKLKIITWFYRYRMTNLYKLTDYYLSNYALRSLSDSLRLFLLVSTVTTLPYYINSDWKCRVLRNEEYKYIYQNHIQRIDMADNTPDYVKKWPRATHGPAILPKAGSHAPSKQPTKEIPVQKLFPLYQPPTRSTETYEQRVKAASSLLKEPQYQAGRDFLATLDQETVIKLFTNHIARKDETP